MVAIPWVGLTALALTRWR